MAEQLIITAGRAQFHARLNDSATARAVAAALPVEARASRWGEEIYFSIPVEAVLEDDARDVLEAGELAFWPPGNAFCIFFGPTPASEGDEIRAASAVNIIGRVEGSLEGLRHVRDGEKLSIRLSSEPLI